MKRSSTWKRLLAAAALGAVALGIYAFWVEPRWLKVTRRRIHLRHLPPPLEGLRIALLTDLHAGGSTPLSLVRRAARLTMHHTPDLVALTGDFAVDEATSFQPVLHALGELRAPLGVYAVPGNHDYAVGIEQWHRDVGANPIIHDLTNTALMLDVNGCRVCIAGVDDFYEGRPQLNMLPPPDARDFTLLLAHSPDQAERARRTHDRVDLILSGHTHGGQVRLPWIGALRHAAEYEELYDEGLRRRPWTQVYTSSGIGTVHLPVRFLCRPEVAILELTSAPRPAGSGSQARQREQSLQGRAVA